MDRLRIGILIDITLFLRLNCFENGYLDINQKYINDYKYFAEIKAYKLCESYKQTHCVWMCSLASANHTLLACGHRFCQECIKEQCREYEISRNIHEFRQHSLVGNQRELLSHGYIRNEERNNNLFIPDSLIGTITKYVDYPFFKDYPCGLCTLCKSVYHRDIETFSYDPKRHDALRSNTLFYPYMEMC